MKSRLVVILLGILIFVLGGIAGAISHSLYQEYIKVAFFKAAQRPPDIVEWMSKELQLDSTQTESLKKIFEESRRRYMDLSQQVWPQYEKIRVETEQQIKSILRADQKARYEDFLRRFKPPDKPPSPKKEGKNNPTLLPPN